MKQMKNRKPQQRNRSYKKEPNRNYKTQKYNNLKKTLLDGIKYRVKMTKHRIHELEDKSIEFVQSEQARENRLKKKKNSLRDLCNK